MSIEAAIRRHYRKHPVKEVKYMNPVLKRFLKGLGAAVLSVALTTALSFTVTFLQTNPTMFAGTAGIIASLLLAAEKAIPNNL